MILQSTWHSEINCKNKRYQQYKDSRLGKIIIGTIKIDIWAKKHVTETETETRALIKTQSHERKALISEHEFM